MNRAKSSLDWFLGIQKRTTFHDSPISRIVHIADLVFVDAGDKIVKFACCKAVKVHDFTPDDDWWYDYEAEPIDNSIFRFTVLKEEHVPLLELRAKTIDVFDETTYKWYGHS